MTKEELNNLLNKRVKSPAPKLQPDPFLPTRLEALAKNENRDEVLQESLLANWSVASILAAGAIIIGIYIGSGLTSESVTSDASNEIITEYSEAFYQSGFVDDWHNVFEDGETQ